LTGSSSLAFVPVQKSCAFGSKKPSCTCMAVRQVLPGTRGSRGQHSQHDSCTDQSADHSFLLLILKVPTWEKDFDKTYSQASSYYTNRWLSLIFIYLLIFSIRFRPSFFSYTLNKSFPCFIISL
jgi:hypothetical protein